VTRGKRTLVKVVAVVSDAVQAQAPETGVPELPGERSSWTTLNTDGQRHPVLNILTLLTFVVGIVAFALGLVVSAHMIATVLGILSFGGGLIVQMNSATRNQRILIITGVIGGFVGMALGIGHGGFA
jgi:hypothetical protein